jgi:predicted membrane chloride channel (bestrophin family)
MDVSRFSCAEKSLESFKKIMLLFVHRIKKICAQLHRKMCAAQWTDNNDPKCTQILTSINDVVFFHVLEGGERKLRIGRFKLLFQLWLLLRRSVYRFCQLVLRQILHQELLHSTTDLRLVAIVYVQFALPEISRKLFLALTDVTDVRRLPART